ncbi:uncharacterized protein [Battus philenor]|uniref:uncharacterized protein n=1 Tax=Battus philenor TaxID=42288 RepID=UPI0035CEA1EA
MQAIKIKNTLNYLIKPNNIKINLFRCLPNVRHNFTTTADTVEIYTDELLKQQKNENKKPTMNNLHVENVHHMTYLVKKDDNNVKAYTGIDKEDPATTIINLLSSNKDKQIIDIMKVCSNHQKFIGESLLNTLFRRYSMTGKPDVVIVLQRYCSTFDLKLYQMNGEFTHYLASAYYFKGNLRKGLSMLSDCYEKYEGLRGVYRIMFKEIIQDTVSNKSEASLVIIKKFVLEFSSKWADNYPLVCFWHQCWSSTWFSDHLLADELLETSINLQNIIQDKAALFSINILREYNDDAVMRLLQALLKYRMMTAYAKVLQALFNYKLRNRDLRGCMEISRNCEALGIALPIDQQGRYLKMLLNKDTLINKSDIVKPTSKNFKLKF